MKTADVYKKVSTISLLIYLKIAAFRRWVTYLFHMGTPNICCHYNSDADNMVIFKAGDPVSH